MRELVFVIVLVLSGCCKNVDALSSDGTKVVDRCCSEGWVKCIADACPNGYVVVRDPGASGNIGIVKCKP